MHTQQRRLPWCRRVAGRGPGVRGDALQRAVSPARSTARLAASSTPSDGDAEHRAVASARGRRDACGGRTSGAGCARASAGARVRAGPRHRARRASRTAAPLSSPGISWQSSPACRSSTRHADRRRGSAARRFHSGAGCKARTARRGHGRRPPCRTAGDEPVRREARCRGFPMQPSASVSSDSWARSRSCSTPSIVSVQQRVRAHDRQAPRRRSASCRSSSRRTRPAPVSATTPTGTPPGSTPTDATVAPAAASISSLSRCRAGRRAVRAHRRRSGPARVRFPRATGASKYQRAESVLSVRPISMCLASLVTPRVGQPGVGGRLLGELDGGDQASSGARQPRFDGDQQLVDPRLRRIGPLRLGIRSILRRLSRCETIASLEALAPSRSTVSAAARVERRVLLRRRAPALDEHDVPALDAEHLRAAVQRADAARPGRWAAPRAAHRRSPHACPSRPPGRAPAGRRRRRAPAGVGRRPSGRGRRCRPSQRSAPRSGDHRQLQRAASWLVGRGERDRLAGERRSAHADIVTRTSPCCSSSEKPVAPDAL
jgi:hypothetical protein